MSKLAVEIEESDRQMILLAIAELSIRRPGWHWTLGRLAEEFRGREMFEQLRAIAAEGELPTREEWSGENPEYFSRPRNTPI